MSAELEHGLGDEYHLDEVDEDNHEVEDSQNVSLIDGEFYDEESKVSDEDYNSLESISQTQVPRLGVGLTLTQLDELESMRSLSPVLTLSQVPPQPTAAATQNSDDDDDDDDDDDHYRRCVSALDH